MQAIIMAGGKGTRLQAITEDSIPKPLVRLHNKRLLDHVLDHAIQNGCDNVIICTGHLGHKIQEHIKQTNYNCQIKISQEHVPLGTAGALHLIKEILADEFVILYADVYTTINIKKMMQFHKYNKADATIAVHTSDHPEDSTVAKLDERGKFVAMIEKPGDNWVKYGNLTQTALYIMKKDVLNFIPQNISVDFAKDVFPKMLTSGKNIYGYKTEEYAKDMGTPIRYAKVLQVTKK